MNRTRRTVTTLVLGAVVAIGGGATAAAAWQSISPQPPTTSDAPAPQSEPERIDAIPAQQDVPEVSAPTVAEPPATPEPVVDGPTEEPTAATPRPTSPSGPDAPAAVPYLTGQDTETWAPPAPPVAEPVEDPCFRQDPECYGEPTQQQLDEERIGGARCPDPAQVIVRVNPDVCGDPAEIGR